MLLSTDPPRIHLFALRIYNIAQFQIEPYCPSVYLDSLTKLVPAPSSSSPGVVATASTSSASTSARPGLIVGVSVGRLVGIVGIVPKSRLGSCPLTSPSPSIASQLFASGGLFLPLTLPLRILV